MTMATKNSTVEPINLYSDNNKYMAAEATTSVDITGTLATTDDVVTDATLQNVGSTAITSWDATTSIMPVGW